MTLILKTKRRVTKGDYPWPPRNDCKNRNKELTRANCRNRLSLAVVLLVMGAVTREECQDVVMAKKFFVVDENGKGRAFLFADKDGALLILCDSDGKLLWQAGL